jgi:hypothetical protein
VADPTAPNQYKFVGDDPRFTEGHFYTKNEIIKRSNVNQHTIRGRLANQREFTEELFVRKQKIPNGGRAKSACETHCEKISAKWLKVALR